MIDNHLELFEYVVQQGTASDDEILRLLGRAVLLHVTASLVVDHEQFFERVKAVLSEYRPQLVDPTMLNLRSFVG